MLKIDLDTPVEDSAARQELAKPHAMTTRAQRDFLKVRLLDTQRLRGVASKHPLMSVALAEREHELQEKIAALPLGNKEARTVLLFSGEARPRLDRDRRRLRWPGP